MNLEKAHSRRRPSSESLASSGVSCPSVSNSTAATAHQQASVRRPHYHQEVHLRPNKPLLCPVSQPPTTQQVSPAQQGEIFCRVRQFSHLHSHCMTESCFSAYGVTQLLLALQPVQPLRILSPLQGTVCFALPSVYVDASMVEHCLSRSKVRIIHSNFHRNHGLTGPMMINRSKAGLGDNGGHGDRRF